MDVPQHQIGRLAWLSEQEQRVWIGGMLPEDVLRLDAMFETWAAKGQLEPGHAGWRTWLMMAGRGFGKTRAGAEWIHGVAMSGKRRIALVAATIDEARAIMVEGKSGLLAIARRRGVKVTWEPSLGRLTWPSGAVATLFSGDNADGLRGPEHDFAWCDELAKWRQAEDAWDNLQMGLRLGVRPRALVTTTPRPMRLLERIRAQRWTVESGGRTGENLSLPRQFVEVMMETYGGSRIGRQELEGELMSEAEGSLFPRELLERVRVSPLSPTPLPRGERGFDRIVVGVDPCASTDGDACGIVVAGRRDGKLFVLADRSVEAASPERWARAVALAAAEWGASHAVADAGLKVRLVHASKGKLARAEPMMTR